MGSPSPESGVEYQNLPINEIYTEHNDQKMSYESEDSDFGDFNPNLHATKNSDTSKPLLKYVAATAEMNNSSLS